MSPSFWKRIRPDSPVAAKLGANIEAYLPRLYTESRQTLFRILLGETLPPRTPFPVDPAQIAEILHRIEALIASDEHLEGCRGKIGEHFPGRLAVLFNLANKEDQLFPTHLLRESIRKHVSRHQAGLMGQPLDEADQAAIEELKGSSRLQQQLAYLVNYTPSKWLLEQEIPVVLESRRRRIKDTGSQPPTEGGFPQRGDAYLWSRDTGRLRGLCLSGGGIRSATFNLGVLQGLAKRNLLRQFDYCSSVSGGGYIHQWLAAWIKREEAANPTASGSPGLDAVCRHLIPQPDIGCGPLTPEPIRWLRRYSNYLTPETGLFSADFWVTVAIWIRNTFLNQVILISFLLSLLLLPHLFLMQKLSDNLTTIGESPSGAPGFPSVSGALIAVILAALVAANYLVLVHNLAAGLHDARKGKGCSSRLNDKGLCLSVVIPALVVSVAVSDFGFYFTVPGLSEVQHVIALCLFTFFALLVLGLAVTWAGGALEKRPAKGDSRPLRVLGFALAAILAALAGTGAILLARNAFVTGNPIHFSPPDAAPTPAPAADPNVSLQLTTGKSQQVNLLLHVVTAPAAVSAAPAAPVKEVELKWRAVVVFGPLVVMAVPFLAIILQCGLVGYEFEDWVLEWLARVRAWATLYSLPWTLLVGIALFGHQLVEWLIRNSSNWIKWPALASWLLTTAGSVVAGKSSSSSGDPNSTGNSGAMKILIAVGPSVYVLGLLLLLAWVAQEALSAAGIANYQLSTLHRYGALCVVILVPVITFLLFGWRVDVNEFSMHSYYRNRLARCYLGASNTVRDPDPLTGFDPADVEGLRLSTFLPSRGYTGPLPVFCASLNISVGEDLAWQERKAASFAFTPVLSGYHVPWTGRYYRGQLSYNGFVPTERFAYPQGGINISTAAAVSGAAISPNWGYHTSPPMAFLLTMFNVRLGWWLENPRRSFLAFNPKGQPPPGRSPFPSPRFAPSQLLGELLGHVGDDREFVYLTDGGHFDNMGLYELVRRRCYEIVICDAEQDAGPVFEGIGMAIRKCRIDFGAEIDLDLTRLASDAATKVSKVHWIAGTIRYPETGDAQPGTVLYIKSSITGDEAADVYNYRLQHTPFPQDSTMDQWFTESQFESYRRLGQQVIDKCPYLDGTSS
jgi:hypothetical protein